MGRNKDTKEIKFLETANIVMDRNIPMDLVEISFPPYIKIVQNFVEFVNLIDAINVSLE